MPSHGSQLLHWARTCTPLLAAVAALAMITTLVAADSPARQTANQPTKSGLMSIDEATAKTETSVAQAQVRPEQTPNRATNGPAAEARRALASPTLHLRSRRLIRPLRSLDHTSFARATFAAPWGR